MKRLVTLLAALAALQTYAQRIEATLPSPDAKSLGMGGVMMTTLSGSHAIYNNSATAIFSHTPSQVSSSYYGQRSFDYYAVSGFCRFDNINLVQAGWRQFLREHGNNDMAVDLGYARRIGDRWAVGIVGRYMHLKRPDISADALAVDLSAAWQRPLENVGSYSTLRAGAKLGNLGGYLRDTEYTLPMDFTVGAALDTFLTDAHEITVGTDLGYYFSPSAVRGFQMSLGAEYNLMQLVQLRTGYHSSTCGSISPTSSPRSTRCCATHTASVSGWISDVKPASPTRSGFIPGRTCRLHTGPRRHSFRQSLRVSLVKGRLFIFRFRRDIPESPRSRLPACRAPVRSPRGPRSRDQARRCGRDGGGRTPPCGKSSAQPRATEPAG